MAGIGFILRKLAAQDNFLGFIRAYLHSAVIAVGPWIMVVCSIAAISTFTTKVVGLKEADEFLAIVLYNFFFSFVVSAPLYMVTTRYVSDSLFKRDASPIPGILVKSLIYLLVPAIPAAALFYSLYATMTPYATVMSVINFGLLAGIWLVTLFLSCIRNFQAITFSWLVSTILTIVSAIILGRAYGSSGMLTGLSIGITYLLYALKSHILAEYPYPFTKPKDFAFYFRNYKGLFWCGFFLFAGMWVDKIIMWWSPEGVTHLNNLRTYPVYDGAMFLSYMSVIPVMALFVFSLETNFYDSYIQYIQHIERNAPLSLIEEEKNNIFTKITENGRSFLIIQGSVTLIMIIFAPTLFNWLGADFLQLSIFRLGALGAFFSAMNLFIVVYFSYFDSQNNMVIVSMTMFFSNAILTLVSKSFGFSYYGYGYCLAMIFTFFVGSMLMVRFLNNLTYHIFITNIIKRQILTEHYDDPKPT